MTENDYSFYLRGIEFGTGIVMRNVNRLPRRPDFETRAEDQLAEARKVLTEALENVIKAQAIYQRKPVDA